MILKSLTWVDKLWLTSLMASLKPTSKRSSCKCCLLCIKEHTNKLYGLNVSEFISNPHWKIRLSIVIMVCYGYMPFNRNFSIEIKVSKRKISI